LDAANLLGPGEPSTDIAETHRFFQRVDAIVESCRVLVFDFSNLPSLSSAWIGRLVFVNKKLKRTGRRLMVVVPRSNQNVMDLFRATRLDKVWRIHEDVETALQHAV
jgi:anti-anti-sigma factor